MAVAASVFYEGDYCYPAGYMNLKKEDVTEILKESL